ncbi:MAG: ABC transporter permease [Chloroflexales bacterium]|nr:ABC transporter permease [Chloroflexales bacterium]
MNPRWHAVRLLLTATWRRTLIAPAATIALIVALLFPLTLGLLVPSYADAAGLRILNEQLAKQARQTQRPAMSLLFRHVRGNKATPWKTIFAADNLVAQNAAQFLAIPLQRITRHIRTVPLQIMLVNGLAAGIPLGTAPIATLIGIEDHMRIVSGRIPKYSLSQTEAMISFNAANTLGLNVGDRIVASTANGKQQLPVTIVGIWKVLDPTSPDWLYDPSTLDSLLLVDAHSMQAQVSEIFPDAVAQAAWYLQPAPYLLGPGDVSTIESRIRTLAQELAKVPAKLERSPLESFQFAQTTINSLTIRTAAVAAPIALLALFFVVQLATYNHERRRDEYALLRSRGVSVIWMTAVSTIEWFCYVMLTMFVAMPCAVFATQIMLRTESFLQFTLMPAPVTRLPLNSFLGFSLIALLIIGLGIRPVIISGRNTLSTSGKSRLNNQFRAAVRLLIEVLIGVAVCYGYYQLQSQQSREEDLFSNPLTLALPVIATLFIALLANRIIPILLILAEKVSRHGENLAAILALQSLARRPERLQTTILLLTLTLGVGGYVASMAATVDNATLNGLRYRIGTDTQFIENAASRTSNTNGERFLLTPLGAHKKIPGIIAYAPVGIFSARVNLGGKQIDTNLIGVDRSRFPAVVTNFRDEWLGNTNALGDLMNQLARTRDGVIISQNIAGSSAIGERIAVTLVVEDVEQETRMRIVGIVTGWPGQYTIDQPFIVTNLSFISDEIGFIPPTDVWATRDTSVTLDALYTAARGAAIPILDIIDFESTRIQEFTRPERQGLFGMLSVGFIAATGLSIMAIFVSALATVRQRSIELGMLYAMGMPIQSARSVIIFEQSIVTGSGVICGLLAAILTTNTILPYIKAGIAPHPDIPITHPVTAGGTLAGMILIYTLALTSTTFIVFNTVRRLRIADAVKLGDEN